MHVLERIDINGCISSLSATEQSFDPNNVGVGQKEAYGTIYQPSRSEYPPAVLQSRDLTNPKVSEIQTPRHLAPNYSISSPFDPLPPTTHPGPEPQAETSGTQPDTAQPPTDQDASPAAPSLQLRRPTPDATHAIAPLVANLLAHAAHPLGRLHAELDAALDAGLDAVDDAERAAAEGAEQGQRRHRPQDDLEVDVVADVPDAVRLRHGHGQDRVRHQPADDHVGAHRLVVVLLLLGLRHGRHRHLEPVAQVAQRLVVARVDVELLRRHLELDRVAARPGPRRRPEVRVDDVVALGAPGDVVRVAEGVHLEHADVGRQQHKVLRRRREHVPRIEVEERHEEVEPDRRRQRHEERREGVAADHELRVLGRELLDDDPERGEDGVDHDDTVSDHAVEVELAGALRTVAHAQDELGTDQQDAAVSQDHEDDPPAAAPERVDLRIREGARDEVERQIEVGEGEVGEDQLDELVDELDVEEDLAAHGMVGVPDLAEMHEGVDGGKEGPIEPSPALGDEFGDGICAGVSARGK